MALVALEERTAAASVTSLARSAGSATSPVIAGLLLQGSLLTYGIPLVLAGGIKVVYDLTLWIIFRRVVLEGEVTAPARPSPEGLHDVRTHTPRQCKEAKQGDAS
jgi:hypothetical protein